MASSHVASLLSCLCALHPSEKCRSQSLCFVLDLKWSHCLRSQRSLTDKTHRLVQLRPRTLGERAASTQSAVPSEEVNEAASKPKARRSRRKPTKSGDESEQQSEPISSKEIKFHDSVRSSQSSDRTAENSSSRTRRTKRESLSVSTEVRSVANAEDSSDDGSLITLATNYSSSADENVEEFIDGDPADVVERGRKSKNAKEQSGRKSRKAAITDETDPLHVAYSEAQPMESPEILESIEPLVSIRENQINSLQSDAACRGDMNSQSASDLEDIDMQLMAGTDILPAAPGSLLGFAHEQIASYKTQPQGQISIPQTDGDDIFKVGRRRARRRRRKSKDEGLNLDGSQEVGLIESFDTSTPHYETEEFPSVEKRIEEREGPILDSLNAWDGTAQEQGLGRMSNAEPQFADMDEIEAMVHTELDPGLIRELHSEDKEDKQARERKVPRASKRSKGQKTEGDAKFGRSQNEAPNKDLLKGYGATARADECISSVMQLKESSEDQMCVVRWLVEAQLYPNQLLFVVGGDSYLGAWDPSLAIGFSAPEETGQPNMWQAESQVPFGTELEYNYFIQVRDGGTDSIVWRPGQRLKLVIPSFKDMAYRVVTVKDSLDFNVENKLPALLWEGWWNEIGPPSELRRFLGAEFVTEKLQQEEQTHSLEQSSSLKSSGADITKKEEQPCVQELGIGQVKKPLNEVLLERQDTSGSSRQAKDAMVARKVQAEENLSGQLSSKLKRLIQEMVFPREEPWLMESMILNERSELLKKPEVYVAGTALEIEQSHSALEEATDSTLPAEKKADVSTEILINSSKCTMERIAILEEGKLVELLLKPIDSDINVGNVYLGAVKKLLPGMTGVFVDIGHPRVALLTITKNRYPYTFPPICASERESRESLTCNPDLVDVSADATGKHEQVLIENLDSEEDLQIDFENEDEAGVEDEEVEAVDSMQDLACTEPFDEGEVAVAHKQRGGQLLQLNGSATKPITVNFGQRFTKWRKVEEGMKIIVQVQREPLGKKGPKVCAFPHLASRFWVLGVGGKSAGVSKKVKGPERKRLRDLAYKLRKPGYDLTARTEAAGQSQEDLEKDFMRVTETWKDIMERAEAAAIAAENGEDGAVPALLHRAMGQSLSIVRDFFAEKVHRMVVDSAQTYHEVTSYLQEVAPQLLNRVELYTGTMPIFDVFNLESEIDRLLCERVQLHNGAYLVIEETEALVSIDVNGGAGMLGKSMKSDAILEANLAAARQIAVELRLRDIGGIIVIDFIDMDDPEHETLVHEEMRKAIQLDRSVIQISEISDVGLMEVTRRRVRPSVTFMISDPCSCCHGTGRVEALETTLSKIERAILRLLANHSHFGGKSWQKVLLRVDPVMFEYLTRKQRASQLSSSIKVHLILKVGREMPRGSFEVSELNGGNEKRQVADGHQRISAHKRLHPIPVGRKA